MSDTLTINISPLRSLNDKLLSFVDVLAGRKF